MHEPHDTDTQMLQSALARLNGVFATNTLRAYRADNLNFIEFCHTRQEAAYPASESVLLAFIRTPCEVDESSQL